MDKPKKSAKKIISIIVFVIGLIALAAGAVIFVLDMLKKPAVEDAEFFVSIDEWVEEDSDNVIWKFTEIGKGTLTTNGHLDDYDFIWSLEGNKLKIETAWLYDLLILWTKKTTPWNSKVKAKPSPSYQKKNRKKNN